MDTACPTKESAPIQQSVANESLLLVREGGLSAARETSSFGPGSEQARARGYWIWIAITLPVTLVLYGLWDAPWWHATERTIMASGAKPMSATGGKLPLAHL